MNRLFPLFLVYTFLVCGCDNSDPTTSTFVGATVQSVRVLAPTSLTQKNNSTTGAIIGGAIAGPTGAVIGSAAGSDAKIIIDQKVERCVVVVKTDEQVEITWDFDNSWGDEPANHAALLCPGDRVNIEKIHSVSNPSKARYKWGAFSAYNFEFGRVGPSRPLVK